MNIIHKEKGMSTKYIYETTVKKQIEERIEEKRIEDGKEITIVSPIKKFKNVKIAIQQPDRKIAKGAELFYSKSIGVYLREGLLPKSLVDKRFGNDGGALTEDEIKRVALLQEILKGYEKEFFEALSIEVTSEKNEQLVENKKNILLKINSANAELASIRNSYADIYDNTVEMKAYHDTIEWLSLYLSCIDEDGKGYKPVFGLGSPLTSNDYDKKIVKLEDYEIKNDPFYNDIIKKLSYLISFWYTSRTPLTQNDFQTMESLYNDSLSTYKIGDIEEVETVKS